MTRTATFLASSLAGLILFVSACAAPDTNFYGADVRTIARESQNPISKLTKVGLESNFDFGVGLEDDLQYVGNLQANVPVALDEDWNVINSFSLPLIHQPELVLGQGDEDGIGNLDYTAYIALDSEVSGIFGFGPVIVAPTSSDDRLGAEELAAGVGLVMLRKPGNWVYGTAVRSVWNVPGDVDVPIAEMQIAVYVNYNLDDGWYWTSTPTLIADYEARSADRWTIPVGGGIGRVVEFGGQPVNVSLQSFWNAKSPDPQGGDWAIVLDFEFLYTKRGFRSWMKPQ